jgi:peptidoglycan L-alanyl-D-glutamate endopeptidase CwlK
MGSRKLEDLHPYLANAYKKAVTEYEIKYPSSAKPFITSTYRSKEEQDALYAQGRTKPGNKVTKAKGGQSLHNYLPSFAFDIAFVKDKGVLDWSQKLFKDFAAIICTDPNIDWGGSWQTFKDTPHFGFKGFTWQMAKEGKQPTIINS